MESIHRHPLHHHQCPQAGYHQAPNIHQTRLQAMAVETIQGFVLQIEIVQDMQLVEESETIARARDLAVLQEKMLYKLRNHNHMVKVLTFHEVV